MENPTKSWQAPAMTWEEQLFALFDDLEAQAESAFLLEREAELADRARAEYAAVTLASRLMASVGSEVVLAVEGVGRVGGLLERVANGWCLLRGANQDWIVALGAVGTVAGSSGRSVPEVAWSAVTRLGLGSALRRLGEAGSGCVFRLRDGSRVDGVVGRVGKDFAEVVTGEDTRTVLVAFAALGAVQSRE